MTINTMHLQIIKSSFIYLLAFSVLNCSCVSNKSAQTGKPLVFVSIVPQKYFVDKLSGGVFDCQVMVPPGVDAHTYEPRPLQMSLLSKARAYFAIGLEFEKPWLPKFIALNGRLLVVHTDSQVPKIAMHDIDEHTAGQSNQDALDPHIWLSPSLVKIQVTSITAVLCKIDSVHAAQFRQNCETFIKSIDSLNVKLHQILPCDSVFVLHPKPFLVFHPTWGYFAKDFCLRQISIEVFGKEPSPRAMRAILDTARQYGIKTVFSQPEYSRKSAEVIAHEIGANVIDADALAYDWPNNLLSVAAHISGK